MKKNNFKINILVSVFLVAINMAVFYQVINHDFINFDDDVYITENKNIQKGINKDSVKWAFTTNYAGFWHPVTWISHMLDYKLYELNPAGHHLSNLLLHILSSLLLFFSLNRLTNAPLKSVFAAMLFGVHPLHVESVVWAAERKDTLSTFFFMLTLYTYSKYAGSKSKCSYFLLIFFFILGLMSKPMLVTLPFILLMLDFWPLKRFGKENSKGLVFEKLPLFFLTFVSCILALSSQKYAGALKSIDSYPLFARVCNAINTYVFYIQKTFVPTSLTLLYPYPERIDCFVTFFSFIGLILVFFLVVKFFRRGCAYSAVGFLWYLGTLVPVIGIIQVGEHPMADRFTYIPLIGLFIVISWGMYDIFEKFRLKNAFAVFSVVVVLSLSILSFRQAGFWKDSESVFKHAVLVTKNNFRAYNNLGIAQAKKGKIRDAAKNFYKALRIKLDYEKAQYNYDYAIAIETDDKKAIKKLSKRLKRRKD